MGYRDYAPAKGRIVDTNGQGDFTTIASAISAASAGQTIFIMPGTYTENLTLKVGVNLTAWVGDADTNNVIIQGNTTHNTAGTVTISGIQLKTNGASCITVSGTVASVLNLINCDISISSSPGITYSSSSSSSRITFYNCSGNVAAAATKIFDCTASGVLSFDHCIFTNTGGSSTASTISSGVLNINYSRFSAPITTSSTATLGIDHSGFDTSAQNAICITAGGSGGHAAKFTRFDSGTASGISVSSTIGLSACTINSSQASSNATAGAGTITFDSIGLLGSAVGIATTTTAAYTNRFGTQRSTKQPAFYAHGNLQSDVTGDGTVYTVLYANEVYDQASNFASPTFTAPVTGRYNLSSGLNMVGLAAAHNAMDHNIVCSNRSIGGIALHPGTCRDVNNRICSVAASDVDMDAADTATVTIAVYSSTKVVDLQGSNTNTFSGHLMF